MKRPRKLIIENGTVGSTTGWKAPNDVVYFELDNLIIDALLLL